MLKLSLSKGTIGNEISFLLLLGLCFFPILPFGIVSALIIATAISSVFFGYKSFNKRWKKISVKPLLINIFFYLILIMTLIYSDNLKVGWRRIEVGLSFLILPIIIFYFQPRLTKNKINILLSTFVASNLILIIYLFFYLVNNASDYDIVETKGLILFIGLKDKGFIDQLTTLWDSTFFEVLYYARKVKESPIFIHKTYLSQSMVWSIFICTHFLIRSKIRWYFKGVNVLLIGLFSIVTIYFFSLVNTAILITLLPFYILFLLKTKKAKIIYIISGIFLVGIIISSGVFKPELANNQYRKNRDYEKPSHILLNINKMLEKDIRNALTTCNIELIKEHPLLGHGVGDVQDNLQECYGKYATEKKIFKEAQDRKLNSHNYYAFLWLSGGVLLVVIFVWLLGHNFFIGIRERDILYVFFLLILSLNLITENTMTRINGILFFSIFNSLFYYKNMILKKNA